MDFKDNVLKKLNTTNLFSVTYRKDKFAISDKKKRNILSGYTKFSCNGYRKASVDLETAFLIGFFISSAVKEVKYYSSVVFQITNKIVKICTNKSRTRRSIQRFYKRPVYEFYI